MSKPNSMDFGLGAAIIVFCVVTGIVYGQEETTEAEVVPICVVWEDATGYAETWITLDDILELEPATPTSCGILVAETEDRIYLAMDHDDGYYAGISTIPVGWIVSRTDKKGGEDID